MQLLLAALTFLIVAAILLASFALSTGRNVDNVVRQRLEAIERSEKRGNASLELKLTRDEMLSSVPALHRVLARWRWAERLQDFIAQAGLKTKPGKLLLVSAVLAAGASLLIQHMYRNPILTPVAGLVMALAPLGYVAFKRSRRLRAFEKSFPEAIDLLTRAVRAGHSFTTGLEMIGTELPEPVAGEFRIAFDEQNFGLPLRDALLNLTERIPLIDVRFFVTALLIQRETGGNLAEILEGLARVIRERFRILGDVRTKTAQGRMTAGMLIALPPALMIVLRMLNPGYMSLLFTDPWGPYMLAIAAVLQVIGTMLLWKIVSIEV